MDTLRPQILAYIPQNEREISDKALILRCIDTFPELLTRDNTICHFTASNWIINPAHTKALMIHHNINNIWMWTGGHADGNSNLFEVALREAREETSIKHIRPLSDQIFSMEVFTVPPHVKHTKFVSSHLHLNCSFISEVDEHEILKSKPDENSGVRWMSFEEIAENARKGTMASHCIGLIERTKEL